MKAASAVILLVVLALLWPIQVQACRIAPRAAALRDLQADAIVLALVTDLKVDGPAWRATAISRGTLDGKAPPGKFEFGSLGSADGPIIVTCDQSWPPKLGRYSVLYLRRSAEGLRVHRAYPYWWARASLDPRLARLDRLLPLGAARVPTPEESRLLDLAEARIELPEGVKDLSRYTRVYERAAPGTVAGKLFRSRKPRRLIVDSTGELPTEKSCGCKLIDVRVSLDDLWAAGKLPAFNP